MSLYAGFDSPYYPPQGERAFQWLMDNTNLFWFGMYIAPYGEVRNHLGKWQKSAPRLRDMGWGLAPIYLGKQPKTIRASLQKPNQEHNPRENGYADGREAVQYAVAASFGSGAVIYFDKEDYEPNDVWLEYYWGWMEAVMDYGYYAGLYGSHLNSDGIANNAQVTGYPFMPHPRVWAVALESEAGRFTKGYRPPEQTKDNHGIVTGYATDPSKYSRCTTASLWQYAHNVMVKWLDETGKKPSVQAIKSDLCTSNFKDPGRWSSES